MKRNLFTCLLVTTILSLFGQSIPNGGFESWSISSYENPQFYMTANFENKDGFVLPVVAQKTTDAYSGSYAIRLTTTATSGTNTAFAWFANGSPEGGSASKGGIPYNKKPTGVRFHYKSNIIAGDSALFLCVFKKNGLDIGFYLFKIASTQTNYTLYNATFSPALPATPDSVIIAAASSNAFLGSGYKAGNMLQIDSIGFTGVTSQPLGFNGNFENWVTISNDKLNGWNMNREYSRTTDFYSGNYALELQTVGPGFGDNSIRVGRAMTGTPTQTNTIGGTPFSNQQDTLVLFYKYLPGDPQDSARVALNFKKNGAFVGGSMTLLGLSATYKQQVIPINLFTAPDTVQITIESSKWPVQSSFIGSDLKVDNMYFTSQKMPISDFILPPFGCVGQPVQLQDFSQNMANAWGWIMPGGTPGSSTAQNPVVTYYSVGIKTITMVSNNQFGAGTPIAKTITINAVPNVASNSSITPCGGSNVVLVASGATSYTWSGGQTTPSISVSPSVTTIYTVTGVASGCYNSAVGAVIVPSVPKPDICMVTVDSLNQYNEIYWDKTLYPNLDSMIIFREVIANTYKRIGAVPKTGLSMFVDTARSVGPANGDPNISTYRYKLQIRDTCGQYGPKSSWHNTVYFTHSGGTFFWTNNYLVEGGINPVQTYSLMVCTNPSVSPTYSVIGTTTGNQSTLNDPFYSIYQTTADWRVEADLGYVCLASQKTAAFVKATKSRSNIQNNRMIGIKEMALKNRLNVYPNPSSGIIHIESSMNESGEITLCNMLGQIVYKDKLAKDLSVKTIDASSFSKGLYILTVNSSNGKAQFKITLE